jgi:hypothetical protein
MCPQVNRTGRPRSQSQQAANRFQDALKDVVASDVELYKSLCWRTPRGQLYRNLDGTDVVIGKFRDDEVDCYRIRVCVKGELKQCNTPFATEDEAVADWIRQLDEGLPEEEDWREECCQCEQCRGK